ncbi:MAG TPA: LysM peptidoglycan-binding domain-containing protein [Chitinophagaceae bacterium]|nr:LysM peptidoglycan-binding domain-containing protein [Chitinophagaceae bacterium]
MKNGIIVVLSLLFFGQTIAQKTDLMIKQSDKGLYLEHKVAPKESYFALGRLYNVHPRFLAAYNKLDFAKGLQIDQKIRIPLTDTNFTQSGGKGTPVYYKCADKEKLSSVSKKNNNVSLANLRWWNNLATDEMKKDSKLIVGFFQSSEMKSVSIAGSPVEEEKTVPKTTDEKKDVVPDADLTKKEEKKVAEDEVKAEKKEEKKDPPPVIKEVKKVTIEGQGYFKNHFEQQIKNNPPVKDETVTAGIFKTLSGWQDAKYYLLIDNVQPGTIVKIINPTNNKAIYAKVLGEMSGIRQNQGLQVRISNAGAAALEITEQDKFIVKVNY